MNVIPETRRVH